MKFRLPQRFEKQIVTIERWAQWSLLLAFRLYVASVFLRSGMVKIQSWDSTLSLFEYEYAVPLLSPTFAAYLATFGELVFPVLLIGGLMTRFGALSLFVLNAVAAISYPELSDAGRADHCLWGAMLSMIIVFGPGGVAIDRWLWRKAS